MTQTTQNANSIRKAAKIKCSVRQLPGRAYLVVTPQNHKYVVRFQGGVDDRHGVCTCQAGSLNMPCYHLPKAAIVDDLTSHMQQADTMRRVA
jgi:hypothetical protein